MIKVFLSHSHVDKPAVREVYSFLNRQGYAVWMDEEDLVAGQNWKYEIARAMEETDIVIIFLSRNSVNREGYAQKEIAEALDKALEKPEGAIFIIPVKLEECVIPRRLSHLHCLNLFEKDGFQKLSKALMAKEGRSQPKQVPDVNIEDLEKLRREAKALLDRQIQFLNPTANAGILAHSTLSNIFSIENEVGRGKHSVVYLARDVYQKTPAAIKLFNPFITSDLKRSENQRKNVLLAKQLGSNHPNLVKIPVEDKNSPAFAMEYISNGNLINWAQSRKTKYSEFITIVEQVAGALDFLHDHMDSEGNQILHLNLKPENILIQSDGSGVGFRAVLSDIGMYSDYRDNPSNSYYVSPEQVQNTDRKTWNGLMDQYSLAVVAYEHLSGKRPFDGDDPAFIASRRLQVAPVPPSSFNYGLPTELNEPIMKALSRTPELRYATCMDFAKALRKAHQAFMQKEVRNHLAKANASLKGSSYDQARASINNALFYDPTNQEALNLLKVLEKKDGSYTAYRDALREWRLAEAIAVRILQVAPNYPDPKNVFSRLHITQRGWIYQVKTWGLQFLVGFLLALPAMLFLIYWILIWIARG